MTDLHEHWKRCQAKQKRAVLAMIVHVEGSAYRREGAACLILEDGTVIGTLSAGCVESDLCEHAKDVLVTGTAACITYDFRPEADVLWGMGAGCNGAVQVILLPIDPVHHPRYARQVGKLLEAKAHSREQCAIGIVLESADPGSIPIGTSYVWPIKDRIFPGLEQGTKGLVEMTLDGIRQKLYVERVQPRPVLEVYGAGADAVPLVQGAKTLGWYVTLVDHRKQALDHPAFSLADERVLIKRDEYGRGPIRDDARIVIMTHQYELDTMLLKGMLFTSVPYLGILGPRRRTERILEEISRSEPGLHLPPLDNLHAPIGLDIGADTPEEIALSILAELVSRRNGRSAQPLRDRNSPMHSRSPQPAVGS